MTRIIDDHATTLGRVIHHYAEPAQARMDAATKTSDAIDETEIFIRMINGFELIASAELED